MRDLLLSTLGLSHSCFFFSAGVIVIHIHSSMLLLQAESSFVKHVARLIISLQEIPCNHVEISLLSWFWGWSSLALLCL